MPTKKFYEKKIKSLLHAKASKELEEQVKAELQEEDDDDDHTSESDGERTPNSFVEAYADFQQ